MVGEQEGLAHSITDPTADQQEQPSAPVLARDGFHAAKLRRRQLQLHATPQSQQQERPLVLTNCRVLDVRAGTLSSSGTSLLVVQGGRIVSLQGAQLPLPANAVVLDCEGKLLMPGLCDAHVHVTATTANLAALYSLSETLVAARSVAILEGMLARGFTTVRDAGGADWGLAEALDEGTLLGPRLLFVGHALSQTGGHGDMRARGEEVCSCGSALRGLGRICDGVDACRAAARDELRKGAHCIKVMASGGVASPTDRLTNTQFSMDELRAIVDEARAAGTYVCAHAYTPAAISRAVEAGVRSIEHGNWLDAATARLMADTGTFLVPTTITYDALRREGVAGGMAAELVAKVGEAVEKGVQAMATARQAGVKMAFGSDLLGAMHRYQADEFLLRKQAGIPAAEILQAATIHAAQLFMQEGVLGELVPGAAADLLLVDGDPLTDVGVLADSSKVLLVVKDGLLAKVPHPGLLRLNELLVPSAES